MDKVYVVIGKGVNQIAIPCLIFKTKQEAEEYIKKYPAPEEDEELATPYFTGAYFGCGGCYQMIVMEVEFGKPFIPFDLD